MELRDRILAGTVIAYGEKGLSFTMDRLSSILGISKKTLYTVFHSKADLMYAMVDYGFDAVQAEKEKILHDDSLSTVQKIRTLLGALPEQYKTLNLNDLTHLKEKFPKAYDHVEERLETGWEKSIALLEYGKKEGTIRDIPTILIKTLLEAGIEQFFRRDILEKNGMSYQEALDGVVDILVYGIAVPEGTTNGKKEFSSDRDKEDQTCS